MKKTAFYFLAFLLASGFSSCGSSVKMALTDWQWQNKKEYPVTDQKPLFKQQTLAFGDFKTQEVKRSWIRGTKSSTGFSWGATSVYVDHLTKKQTFRFKLQNGANFSEVFCATNLKAKDLVLGKPGSPFNTVPDLLTIGLESDNQFYARIYPDSTSRAWELFLDNQAVQRSKTYAGTLLHGSGNYYSIVPVNTLEGKKGPVRIPFGAIGYEFRNPQNQPVAAVSIIDKGVVYFNEVPETERFLLANACAALLLQANDL